MSRSWTIGNSQDCDLVVNRETVSGHHCRLTRGESDGDAGFLLEDLGSTNGTYVNGARITARTRVTPVDAITLGQTIPMPWPPEIAGSGPKVLRIGREPDNDFVLNLPTVSGHHARVLWEGKPGTAIIEDLKSSNGTAVGAPDRKIARSVISASDTVYLGTHPVAASELLARLDPAALAAPAPVSWAPPPLPSRKTPTAAEQHTVTAPLWDASASRAPVPGLSPPGSAELRDELLGIVNPLWLPAVLFFEPLLAGLMIVLAFRGNVPAPATAEGGGNIATIVFWLGLAAIWFGVTNALLASTFTTARLRGVARLVPRLAVLGAVCTLQCFLAWAVVTLGAALQGAGLSSLAVLVLASAVGLALGLAIVVLVPRPAFAWTTLPLIVALLWLLGGQWQPLPQMGTLARTAAAGVPSRWAFEGLLLLESDRRSAGAAGSGANSIGDGDLAESYFPAATVRMGVAADTLALGAMLIGLVATALFIATQPEPSS